MKKTALFRLTLLGLAGVVIQSANAGSAVALALDNQLVVSYGHPVEIAKKRALDEARRKFGSNVRILGATDTTGYGAIAIARHANGYGWIMAAALGKRSATEADTMAVQHCLKVGGTNPKVIWGFRG